MTRVTVSDAAVEAACLAHEPMYDQLSGDTRADMRKWMRAAIAAAVPNLLERQGFIAEVELGGLEAARKLGTKTYGTLWSEPTGQAGTPLYTIRTQENADG